MCVFLSAPGGPANTGGCSMDERERERETPTKNSSAGVKGRWEGGGVCWLQSVTAANWIRVCFSAVGDSRLMWFLQLPEDQLIRSNSQPSKREGQQVLCVDVHVRVWHGSMFVMFDEVKAADGLIFLGQIWPLCWNQELGELCVCVCVLAAFIKILSLAFFLFCLLCVCIW